MVALTEQSRVYQEASCTMHRKLTVERYEAMLVGFAKMILTNKITAKQSLRSDCVRPGRSGNSDLRDSLGGLIRTSERRRLQLYVYSSLDMVARTYDRLLKCRWVHGHTSAMQTCAQTARFRQRSRDHSPDILSHCDRSCES